MHFVSRFQFLPILIFSYLFSPIKQISILTEKLSSLTNYIIRDITDPLLLQPAYLDLVTLKKRESDLGFYIMSSYQFIHRITDIKYNSPAHNNLKVEDGDEIIQVNYQTVVGWQVKKVLLQLEESTTDVLLTLKKRPKHMKSYGQLGMIKLPSKKRAPPFMEIRENLVLPSPKFDFVVDNKFLSETDATKNKENISEVGDSSGNESDSITPNEARSPEKELRMYLPKPGAETRVLQRRHTICSDDLRIFQNIGNHHISKSYWQNLNNVQENLESPSLRDKSVSFGFGLNQRPSTCLGINENMVYNKVKGSLPRMPQKTDAIIECDENCEANVMGASKVVRFDPSDSDRYENDSKYTCNVEDTIIESLVPFPYVDEDSSLNDESGFRDKKSLEPPKPAPRTSLLTHQEKSLPNGQQYVEAVNVVILQKEETKRGKLDKSYSTPTYNDEAGTFFSSN